MTRHTQIAKILYVLVALGVCASPLLAEDRTPVFKGTCNLSYETRWGSAVLPPGEYTISVHSTTLPARVTVRGKNGSIFVIAQSLTQRSSKNGNSFLLVSKWRRGIVRSLYVSELGLAFNYPTPKDESKEMTQEAMLIHRIPVTKAEN